MRAVLLASATITNIGGLRVNIRANHEPAGGEPLSSCPAHHAATCDDEKTPQSPIAHARGAAKAIFAPGRLLYRRQPDPSRKISARPKSLDWRAAPMPRCRRNHRSDAGNAHQSPRDFVALGALGDLLVENNNLFVQLLQSVDKQEEAFPRGFWYVGVQITYVRDQRLDVGTSLRHDQAIFSKGDREAH